MVAMSAAPGSNGLVPKAVATIRPGVAFGAHKCRWFLDQGDDAVVNGFGRDRFGQEIGHAGISSLDHAFHLGMAGQHDDRNFGVADGAVTPDPTHQLDAVDRLHGPVGDDEIDGDFLELVESGLDAGRLVDPFDPEGFEDPTDQLEHMSIVVHDQGRFGKPVEVADLVLFLASPASDTINGDLIMLDGGYTAL